MSIASKLQELDAVKDDIFDAIEAKGVTVPAGSGLADAPALIGSIPGGGGGGGNFPEGYKPGCIKLNTTSVCSIALDSTKLQIHENSILDAKFFIVGGYSGWGSELNLVEFESRSGQSILIRFRNNTSSTKCIAEFREIYNSSQWVETSAVSALSIQMGINESSWNGSNVYGYDGRKSGRINGNGIKEIFNWGAGSGDYTGSVFYELTIKENDANVHKLIPAKKQDNSVIILDCVTLDEYSVNTSFYQFIEQ